MKAAPALGATLLISLALSFPTGARAQGVLFSEGFDGYPAGTFPTDWQLVFNGNGDADQYVTNSVSRSPPNSLHLRGLPGGCWEAMAGRPFSSAETRIRWTVDLRVEQLNLPWGCGGAAAVIGFSHPSGAFGNYVAPVVVATNGSIEVSGIPVAATLSAGIWYEISLLLDRQDNVASLWLNGNSLGSFPAAPDSSELSRITMLSLTSGHTGPDVYFDDVLVQAETQVPSPSNLLLLGIAVAAGTSGGILGLAPPDLRSRTLFPFFAIAGSIRRQKHREALTRFKDEMAELRIATRVTIAKRMGKFATNIDWYVEEIGRTEGLLEVTRVGDTLEPKGSSQYGIVRLRPGLRRVVLVDGGYYDKLGATPDSRALNAYAHLLLRLDREIIRALHQHPTPLVEEQILRDLPRNLPPEEPLSLREELPVRLKRLSRLGVLNRQRSPGFSADYALSHLGNGIHDALYASETPPGYLTT